MNTGIIQRPFTSELTLPNVDVFISQMAVVIRVSRLAQEKPAHPPAPGPPKQPHPPLNGSMVVVPLMMAM